MEKAIIQNLHNSLPGILPLLRKEKNLVINYDNEADVLYVSFGQPRKADDTEIVNENTLVRKNAGRVIGITFLHFNASVPQRRAF